MAPPALTSHTTFNAERTTLTLAVRDPYLADLPTPTRVDLRLSHNVIYDEFNDVRLS